MKNYITCTLYLHIFFRVVLMNWGNWGQKKNIYICGPDFAVLNFFFLKLNRPITPARILQPLAFWVIPKKMPSNFKIELIYAVYIDNYKYKNFKNTQFIWSSEKSKSSKGKCVMQMCNVAQKVPSYCSNFVFGEISKMRELEPKYGFFHESINQFKPK